uniref:NADH-ubiquinone oxidoreductase chain 4 n=1 Tax=Apteropeda orbiculata TaxID=467478 RepID=A0A3G1GT14_9CUCU|nr:NADH dehydrogenase subunit 4 [Apteropeda orbiculata]
MKFLFSLMMLSLLSFKLNFWIFMWMFLILTFLFMFNYLGGFYCEISYFFGCDMLSFSLVLLSFWICSLMILASSKIFKMKNYHKFFILMMGFLLISLFITFLSLNIFVFYLFFEVSLIPTMILIFGWGYQPERLEAGLYLLFYTLFMSLPMMVIIFYLYYKFDSLYFLFLGSATYEFIYVFINMVFFVKIPMFFLHLWLPKAHVEAPVSGSMILAGIMLKLGGYGLLRFMILFKDLLNSLNILIIIISLMGGFIVSLICIRQSDLKSLIAYSSVAHMGLVLSGILTLNYYGIFGGLILMLGHGLCSSGLFCLVNLIYERTFSRSLYLNKGLLNLLPSLSMWWFLLLSSNMACPPSLNLMSEIMLINSILSFSSFNMLFLSFISFFSAAYSLFLYSYTQHGVYFSGTLNFCLSESREFLLLLLHWVPLNLLFMKMDLFL